VRTVVGCGQPVGDIEIAIVDPGTRIACDVGDVGEIWIRDPCVAQGYWRQPEESKSTFRARISDTGGGPYLRTGDLGFLHEGELFVTGRIKDLVIIRGSNHYPQDLEWTVQASHPALAAGVGAAFSVDTDAGERLVILHELPEARQGQDIDVAGIAGAARAALAEAHEIELYALGLVRRGGIPRTSSGKIQRQQCLATWLAGDIATLGIWRESGGC
jgi:acyl-CoA synthetase (AMP-forming)/AMP-acid ligase II